MVKVRISQPQNEPNARAYYIQCPVIDLSIPLAANKGHFPHPSLPHSEEEVPTHCGGGTPALGPVSRGFYNTDETGLYYRDSGFAHISETLSGAKKAKDRVTVLLAAYMTGLDKRQQVI